MWSRARIFRTFILIFSLFLITQLLVYFLIPNVSVLDKIRIDQKDYAIKYDNVFVLPRCLTQNQYAFSAFNRSKTESCKRQIVSVACRHSRQKRPTLPIYCPNQRQLIDGPTYLGCFRDKHSPRDLDVSLTKTNSNTPDACIDICISQGTPLAGVQFGGECLCGNSKERLYDRLPESRCSTPCPGDPKQKCGGFLSQRIFQTGIKGPLYRYSHLVDPAKVEQDIRQRIVYLLVLNGRDWRQIKRLFKLIYHANHYFFIHIDKRRNYLYGMAQTLVRNYPNVRLTSFRMSTIWGGASLLQMFLGALRELLGMKDWHWNYVINLSESDLPVKTDDYLTAFLTKNAGKNFLKSQGQNPSKFMAKQGMDRLFLECDEHLWLIGKREVPRGVMFNGGSDWVALHRDFVEYAVHSTDPLVTGLKEYFQYSLLPVESFFHTLAQNSKFCTSVIDNNLHFTNWDRTKGCHCQQRNIVDWCGCSPSVIRNEDLPRLKSLNWTEATAPRPIFFARKFDPTIDQTVINSVEKMLYGKFSGDDTVVDSYWQSLYSPTLDKGGSADLHRSFLTGLITIAVADMDPLSDHCGAVLLGWEHPGEAHVHFMGERQEGVTVGLNFSGADGEGTVWGEMLFSRSPPQLQREKKPATKEAAATLRRLRKLEIGSRYDPKENVFRNYAGVFGPNSIVTVLHEWGVGDAMTVHFLWLDPGSQPAVLLRVSIPGSVPHRSNFDFHVDHGPLRAGHWVVKVLDERGTFLAQTSFIVLPELFVAGSLILNTDTARAKNCGPVGRRYSNTAVDSTVAQVDTEQERRSNHECSLAEDDAAKHASRLLAQEWIVREWCISDVRSMTDKIRDFRRVCRRYEICEMTSWSSLTPDPKSELRTVNGRTGRLL